MSESKGAFGAGDDRPSLSPAQAAEGRMAARFVEGLGRGRARPKRKISVTIDADLWDEVGHLVQSHGVESASSAVEGALALWTANQRLRQMLDELYAEMPDARPTEEMIEAAERKLGWR